MVRAFTSIAVLALLAGTVRAQPQTAAQLEAAGLAAANRGDTDAAIAAFTGAYAKDPQPRFRCNLGTAYYTKSDFQRAHLFLNWCLDRIAAAPEGMARVAGFVDGKLREAGMVKVRITTAPTGALIVLKDLGTLASPVTVFLPVATHKIDVSRDGYKPASEQFTLLEKQDRKVAVALEAIATEPTVPVKEPASDPPAIDPPKEPIVGPVIGRPVEVESRWRRVPAYVSGGVAVASLAVGFGFYLHARDIAKGLATKSGTEYDRGKDRAERNHRIAIGGWAVAGAAAALSAYLFARPEKTSAKRLSVGAAPTRGGAIVGASIEL